MIDLIARKGWRATHARKPPAELSHLVAVPCQPSVSANHVNVAQHRPCEDEIAGYGHVLYCVRPHSIHSCTYALGLLHSQWTHCIIRTSSAAEWSTLT